MKRYRAYLNENNRSIQDQLDERYGHHDSDEIKRTASEFERSHTFSDDAGRAWKDYSVGSREFNKALVSAGGTISKFNNKPPDETYDSSHTRIQANGYGRDNLQHITNHLDHSMKPMNKSHIVYHGAGEGFGNILSNMKHGDIHSYPGYTSASLSHDIAYDSVPDQTNAHMARITIPHDHPSAYVSNVSKHSSEREMVLPRHTLLQHSGRVDDFEDHAGNKLSVHHLEAVHRP